MFQIGTLFCSTESLRNQGYSRALSGSAWLRPDCCHVWDPAVEKGGAHVRVYIYECVLDVVRIISLVIWPSQLNSAPMKEAEGEFWWIIIPLTTGYCLLPSIISGLVSNHFPFFYHPAISRMNHMANERAVVQEGNIFFLGGCQAKWREAPSQTSWFSSMNVFWGLTSYKALRTFGATILLSTHGSSRKHCAWAES